MHILYMTIHPTFSLRMRRMTTALVAASFFVAQAVQACPGCKQALGGDGAGGNHTVNGAGLGYALTIGGLLFTVVSLLGTLGYLAYRNCLALAAQHEAAFATGSRA